MTIKIDNKLIESLKPTGEQYYIWQNGFGIRVNAKGSMSYVVQTKEPGQKKPSPKTIGKVGELGIRQARDIALACISESKRGAEILDIAQESSDITFDEAARQYVNSLLKENGLDPKIDIVSEYWPSDVRSKRNTYRRFSKEKMLSDRLLSSITRDDIRDIITPMRRSKPSMGLLVKSHFSSLFDYHINESEALKLVENPASKVKGWTIARRAYALNEEEAAAFSDLLDQAFEHSPIVASYLRFRLTTGMRVTESVKLCWKDDGFNNYVDIRNKEIVVREHKNRNRNGKDEVIALTDSALRVLQNMKSSGLYNKNSPYIFWSEYHTNQNGFISRKTSQKVFKRLIDKVANSFGWSKDRRKHITQYNLRHTFATLALDIEGIRIVDIKNQLGHANLATTMHYLENNKEGRDRMREGMSDRYSWM